MYEGVDLLNFCIFCGWQGESTLHVFWACKFSREVMREVRFGPLVAKCQAVVIFLLLRDMRDELKWEKFEEFVVLLWVVWNCRDRGRFKGELQRVGLSDWAVGSLEAFQ